MKEIARKEKTAAHSTMSAMIVAVERKYSSHNLVPFVRGDAGVTSGCDVEGENG